jgi:hypothetical protein
MASYPKNSYLQNYVRFSCVEREHFSGCRSGLFPWGGGASFNFLVVDFISAFAWKHVCSYRIYLFALSTFLSPAKLFTRVSVFSMVWYLELMYSYGCCTHSTPHTTQHTHTQKRRRCACLPLLITLWGISQIFKLNIPHLSLFKTKW